MACIWLEGRFVGVAAARARAVGRPRVGLTAPAVAAAGRAAAGGALASAVSAVAGAGPGDPVDLGRGVPQRGPTSSTSTSYTVRFSPSLVSYDRCRSRPETMTRIPRVSDSAAFSAACRHTLQVRNRLSPSFHSPVELSRNLGVEATRNRATGWPAGVKRSSGSSTRLPAIVIWVSPAAIGVLQLVTDSAGNKRAGRPGSVVIGPRDLGPPD